MTRNEQIASIMLEAAELLKESAGANGATKRYYDERLKNAKQRDGKEYFKNRSDEYDTKDVSKNDINRRIKAGESRDFAADKWDLNNAKVNNDVMKLKIVSFIKILINVELLKKLLIFFMIKLLMLKQWMKQHHILKKLKL